MNLCWCPAKSESNANTAFLILKPLNLYIHVGGFDDNSPLDSVERYDSSKDSWTLVAPMSCPRGGVGVAALGGKIYSVGGHDGTNYLNSVEAFDPIEDR